MKNKIVFTAIFFLIFSMLSTGNFMFINSPTIQYAIAETLEKDIISVQTGKNFKKISYDDNTIKQTFSLSNGIPNSNNEFASYQISFKANDDLNVESYITPLEIDRLNCDKDLKYKHPSPDNFLTGESWRFDFDLSNRTSESFEEISECDIVVHYKEDGASVMVKRFYPIGTMMEDYYLSKNSTLTKPIISFKTNDNAQNIPDEFVGYTNIWSNVILSKISVDGAMIDSSNFASEFSLNQPREFTKSEITDGIIIFTLQDDTLFNYDITNGYDKLDSMNITRTNTNDFKIEWYYNEGQKLSQGLKVMLDPEVGFNPALSRGTLTGTGTGSTCSTTNLSNTVETKFNIFKGNTTNSDGCSAPFWNFDISNLQEPEDVTINSAFLEFDVITSATGSLPDGCELRLLTSPASHTVTSLAESVNGQLIGNATGVNTCVSLGDNFQGTINSTGITALTNAIPSGQFALSMNYINERGVVSNFGTSILSNVELVIDYTPFFTPNPPTFSNLICANTGIECTVTYSNQTQLDSIEQPAIDNIRYNYVSGNNATFYYDTTLPNYDETAETQIGNVSNTNISFFSRMLSLDYTDFYDDFSSDDWLHFDEVYIDHDNAAKHIDYQIDDGAENAVSSIDYGTPISDTWFFQFTNELRTAIDIDTNNLNLNVGISDSSLTSSDVPQDFVGITWNVATGKIYPNIISDNGIIPYTNSDPHDWNNEVENQCVQIIREDDMLVTKLFASRDCKSNLEDIFSTNIPVGVSGLQYLSISAGVNSTTQNLLTGHIDDVVFCDGVTMVDECELIEDISTNQNDLIPQTKTIDYSDTLVLENPHWSDDTTSIKYNQTFSQINIHAENGTSFKTLDLQGDTVLNSNLVDYTFYARWIVSADVVTDSGNRVFFGFTNSTVAPTVPSKHIVYALDTQNNDWDIQMDKDTAITSNTNKQDMSGTSLNGTYCFELSREAENPMRAKVYQADCKSEIASRNGIAKATGIDQLRYFYIGTESKPEDSTKKVHLNIEELLVCNGVSTFDDCSFKSEIRIPVDHGKTAELENASLLLDATDLGMEFHDDFTFISYLELLSNETSTLYKHDTSYKISSVNPTVASVITNGESLNGTTISDLTDPTVIKVFDLGDSSQYAIVTSRDNDAVQIFNVTNIEKPIHLSTMKDDVNGFNILSRPSDVVVLKNSNTHPPKYFAYVSSYGDNGIQVIDVTDPINPIAVSSIQNGVNGISNLERPEAIDGIITEETSSLLAVAAIDSNAVSVYMLTGGNTLQLQVLIKDGENGFNDLDQPIDLELFLEDTDDMHLAVASRGDSAVSIIEINVFNFNDFTLKSTAKDGIGGFDALASPADLDVVKIGDDHYVFVTDVNTSGVQIIGLVDSSVPTAEASFFDGSEYTTLQTPVGISVIDIEDETVALVTSFADNGIQLINVTQINNPQPLSTINKGSSGFDKLTNPFGITTLIQNNNVHGLVTAKGDNSITLFDINTIDRATTFEIKTNKNSLSILSNSTEIFNATQTGLLSNELHGLGIKRDSSILNVFLDGVKLSSDILFIDSLGNATERIIGDVSVINSPYLRLGDLQIRNASLSDTELIHATVRHLEYPTTSSDESTPAAPLVNETLLIENLEPHTPYCFKLAFSNTVGWSDNSSPQCELSTATIIPQTPTGLTASAISHDKIFLDWDDAVNPLYNVTGYIISVESPTGNGFTTLISNTGNNTTQYTDTSLTEFAQYNYKVAAINDYGTSSDSNEASATTNGHPDKPTWQANQVPTLISVVGILEDTKDYVKIGWNPSVENGVAVSYYELERSRVVTNNFSLIATIPASEPLEYIDTELTSFEFARYKLVAVSTDGDKSVQAFLPFQKYVFPPDFTLSNPNSSETIININWISVQNASGYKLEFETPVGNGFSTLYDEALNNTNTNFNHTGLTGGQTYNYKMYTYNEGSVQLGYPSDSQQFSPYHIPDSVTDLVAIATSLNNIILTWSPVNPFAHEVEGYLINYTDAHGGTPLTQIATTTGDATSFLVTGINPAVENSFRIAAITSHTPPYNITGANIARVQPFSNFTLGDLHFPDEDDTAITMPVTFSKKIINDDTIAVDVFYPNTATDFECDIKTTNENTITKLTNMNKVNHKMFQYNSTITINGAGNDIVNIDCFDTINKQIKGNYALGNSTIPFFALIQDFKNGTLIGGDGSFSGIDFVTLLVIIVSMIGFNRSNPAAGIIISIMVLGTASYYQLIALESTLFGALALVVGLSIVIMRAR